jgi:preprotein translocase subunit SecF
MENKFHSRKKSLSMSSKQQGKAGVVLLIIVVLIIFLASLAISSSWNTAEYSPIVAQENEVKDSPVIEKVNEETHTVKIKEETSDETDSQRFGKIQYKVEKEAVINSKIDEDILSQLILAVLVNGYKCDTVSSAIPYIRGGGYTIQCNNYQYEYEIEDKGGNIVVTVQ